MARRRGRKRAARRRRRSNPYFLNRAPRRRRRTHRRRRAYTMGRAPIRRLKLNRRRRVHHRRHFRRNPQLLGLNLPPLDAVIYVGAGFIVPPMVSGYLMAMVPTAWQGSPAARWVVKAAAAFGPPILVRRFISQRAGNLMMIGGAVSFAMDLVREFMPGMIPGLSGQPLLGAYFNQPVSVRGTPAFPRPRTGMPPMLTSAPTRLSPDTRF